MTPRQGAVVGFKSESRLRTRRGILARYSLQALHIVVLPVLPVLPFHVVGFEIAGDGYADCREEVILSKLREEAKSFQLVLHGIFEFRKTKLYALRVQRSVQFGNHVAGGDVYARDRLRGNN